jgi:hypothetical protein
MRVDPTVQSIRKVARRAWVDSPATKGEEALKELAEEQNNLTQRRKDAKKRKEEFLCSLSDPLGLCAFA